MFLPDESTLAGRLCALASAAELGLLTTEYQRKQRKRHSNEVMFKHAPRVGSMNIFDPSDPMDDADLVTAMISLAHRGNGARLSTLAFHRLFSAEANGLMAVSIMVICLHCYGVFSYPNGALGGKIPDFCSEECKQAAIAAYQRKRHQRKRHYIRFGLWDASAERSIDFQLGVHEPGVSTYDAIYDEEDGCYRLDFVKVSKYARRAKVYLPMLLERHIFIITGDETEPGVDGETCLRNVRLVAPAIWRNHQIVPIPLERLMWLAEALGFDPGTSAGAVPPSNG